MVVFSCFPVIYNKYIFSSIQPPITRYELDMCFELVNVLHQCIVLPLLFGKKRYKLYLRIIWVLRVRLLGYAGEYCH